MSVLIVIPARMKATRLPNKPLAMINGEPMIVHVWRRAVEAKLGEVIVACDGHEIAKAIEHVGGKAVITDPNHPSGSDRIWEALNVIEGGLAPYAPEALTPAASDSREALRTTASPYEIIVNLQGDVPTLDPQLLHELIAPLENKAVDIATLVTEITLPEEHTNPSVVKAVITLDSKEKTGRALYFTRATAPANDGPRYHHIGVYAYRRAALKQFVSLKPSPLEIREKLEQLRALEAGMRIDVRVVDTVPLGVDTPEDLIRAQELLSGAT